MRIFASVILDGVHFGKRVESFGFDETDFLEPESRRTFVYKIVFFKYASHIFLHC